MTLVRRRSLSTLLMFAALGFCLSAGIARASASFTLTQTPDFTLSSSTGHTSVQQAWDFTTLPYWNPAEPVLSIVITETFSANSIFGFLGDAFQSTILNGPYEANPGTSQTQDYFIFDNSSSTLAPTATKTATLNAPYPCCSVSNPVGSEPSTLADITNPTGDVLGQ